MKRGLLLLILISIGVLVLCSCDSDSTKPHNSRVLTGFITNENNEPVEGTKIVLSYHYEEVARPETNFRFELDLIFPTPKLLINRR
jgi:hypothetical protein